MTVARELDRRGIRVRMVNRSGNAEVPSGVETVAADLSDPSAAREATHGSAVVYNAINPAYHKWIDLFPPIHTNVIEATTRAEARLVMADNLYMYRRPADKPMSEDSPVMPATPKGELRARMATELFDAHDRGDIEAVIGRASDYFGPLGLTSQMGARVFGPLLEGKNAQVLGDPDTRHTYTYLPDIGRSLVTLGASSVATGQVWHVPSPSPITTRQFIGAIADQLDIYPGISVMPPALLAALSWFSPTLRAVREEVFQVQSDWVMDDSKYREAFGRGETPLEDAIAATLEWFRHRM